MTPSAVASGKDTVLIHFVLIFLKLRTHFLSPEKVYIFMKWKVFLHSSNWCVRVLFFFLHPILGRMFLSAGKVGGEIRGQLLPFIVCTLNKIFRFLQILGLCEPSTKTLLIK